MAFNVKDNITLLEVPNTVERLISYNGTLVSKDSESYWTVNLVVPAILQTTGSGIAYVDQVVVHESSFKARTDFSTSVPEAALVKTLTTTTANNVQHVAKVDKRAMASNINTDKGAKTLR